MDVYLERTDLNHQAIYLFVHLTYLKFMQVCAMVSYNRTSMLFQIKTLISAWSVIRNHRKVATQVYKQLVNRHKF